MKNLCKKCVMISGSNRGIGRATAEVFAENGYDIVAHARAPSDAFSEFHAYLKDSLSVNVVPIYFDMRDEEEMKAQVKEVLYKPKITIDVLVNSAAITGLGLLLLTPMKTIRNIFEVNLFSHMRLTQLILKRMPMDGGSHIVNVASVSGISLRGGQSGYGVSKAALLAWTQVMKEELRGKVTVNAVAPGQTDTDMTRFDAIGNRYWSDLAGRVATPREIADAIFFLGSEKAGFISGAVLKIDGGAT